MEIIIIIVGVVGLVLSSQAAIGTSVVAFACVLGISHRLSQARAHKNEISRLIKCLIPDEEEKEKPAQK